MGAAIAFNTLFALVPLAVAFVSVITLLDQSSLTLSNFFDVMRAALPEEIAALLINVIAESTSFVAGERTVILILSVLVALWSGSRAVYALQKALRLVQGGDDDRGYFRNRFIGIFVTVGGAVGVVAGYSALLLGRNAWEKVSDWLNLPSIGMAQVLLGLTAFGWIFALVWVIYRYGPPVPIRYAGVAAAIVAAVILLGTIGASLVVPSFDTETLAVFGSIGLVLLWLYGIGVVVVSLPIAAISFGDAIDAQRPG
jgi:membrane protein